MESGEESRREQQQQQNPKCCKNFLFGLFVSFGLCVFVVLYFAIAYVPHTVDAGVPLLPGESITLEDFVRRSSFWYEKAECSTPLDQGPPLALYYFEEGCPDPQLIRQTTYITLLDDIGSHLETFYLNKGSSFSLEWNSPQAESGQIQMKLYESYHKYIAHRPKITTHDTQLVHEVSKSNMIYIKWVYSGYKSRRFQGEAQFDFNLTAYDHDEASFVCYLDNQTSCGHDFSDNSCAVIDIVDFSPFDSPSSGPLSPSSPHSTYTTIHIGTHNGRYWEIVIAPMLVVVIIAYFFVAT